MPRHSSGSGSDLPRRRRSALHRRTGHWCAGRGPRHRASGLRRRPLARLGADAYPTLHDKAAALLHSIVRNHALVDGNKRLGLAAVIAFYGLNGRRLTISNDEAYDFVIAVAAGQIDDVAEISQRLEDGSAAR